MPYYRTRDEWATFGFSIEWEDGEYRVYINGWADGRMPTSSLSGCLSPIDYGSRDDGAHATHRLTGSAGRKYVCWDRPIVSSDDARNVCALWAEKTAEYIRTGRRF